MSPRSHPVLAATLGLLLLAACGKSPAQWLEAGKTHAQSGKHEAAVHDFDKALEQPSPLARAAQFEKAKSLLALQQWDEAARSALASAQGQVPTAAYPAKVIALQAMAGAGNSVEGERVMAQLGPAAWDDPAVAEAATKLGLARPGDPAAAPPAAGHKRRPFDITKLNAIQIDIAAVNVADSVDPALFPKRTVFQDPRLVVKVPSPDGKRLVWRGLEKKKGYYLYLSDADGRNPERLDRCKNGYQPVWSPDGKRILYSAMDWKIQERNLFIYDVATKKERRAFTAKSKVGPLASWSPDGSKIVFTYFNELWIMNANGIGRGLLNLGGRMKMDVVDAGLIAWSADGSHLAYQGRHDPKAYLIDLTSKI